MCWHRGEGEAKLLEKMKLGSRSTRIRETLIFAFPNNLDLYNFNCNLNDYLPVPNDIKAAA